MPTLEGITFQEAIAPAILAMYGGEVKVVTTDDSVTLTFPNMLSAASWANTSELSDYTWLSKAWAAFSSTVEVDVMRPHPED